MQEPFVASKKPRVEATPTTTDKLKHLIRLLARQAARDFANSGSALAQARGVVNHDEVMVPMRHARKTVSHRTVDHGEHQARIASRLAQYLVRPGAVVFKRVKTIKMRKCATIQKRESAIVAAAQFQNAADGKKARKRQATAALRWAGRVRAEARALLGIREPRRRRK